MLHRHRREVVVADDDINRLVEETRHLIDEVISTDDLDEPTTTWMVSLLRKLEQALLNVKITGSAQIDEAANIVIGSVMRYPSRMVRIMTHPVWHGISVLLTVNTALGSVAEYQQITGDQQQRIVVEVTGPQGPLTLPSGDGS